MPCESKARVLSASRAPVSAKVGHRLLLRSLCPTIPCLQAKMTANERKRREAALQAVKAAADAGGPPVQQVDGWHVRSAAAVVTRLAGAHLLAKCSKKVGSGDLELHMHACRVRPPVQYTCALPSVYNAGHLPGPRCAAALPLP